MKPLRHITPTLLSRGGSTRATAGPSRMVLIHDETSPNTYRFAMDVPPGEHTEVNPDGSATIYDKNGNVVRQIARARAFDAAGRLQRTWYDADENGDLIQHVEPVDDARYPILANPTTSSETAAEIARRAAEQMRAEHELQGAEKHRQEEKRREEQAPEEQQPITPDAGSSGSGGRGGSRSPSQNSGIDPGFDLNRGSNPQGDPRQVHLMLFFTDNIVRGSIVLGFVTATMESLIPTYGINWLYNHRDQIPDLITDRLPGRISAPAPVISGVIAKFFSENPPENTPKYNPSDRHQKSTPHHGRQRTVTDQPPAAAQKVLKDSVTSGDEQYGYKDGNVYEFQPDRTEGYLNRHPRTSIKSSRKEDNSAPFRLRMAQTAPANPANRLLDPTIRVFLVEEDTGREIDILHEPIEMARLVEWILDNSVRISTELPPFDLYEGESIAAGYRRVLAVLPQVGEITGSEDIWLAAADIMVGYQRSHSIDRALGGMNFPEIYLGVSPTGAEISCADGGIWDWKYSLVGYDEFLVWLAQEIDEGRLPVW